MRIVPLELVEANRFVMSFHRHHRETQGHRFSIGVRDDAGELRGVAIVGRPVARLGGKPSETVEVTRLCTDGAKNACSMLYAAAARAAKELGYIRIQTYILDTEPGTTLKASGWTCEGVAGGGIWHHTDGKPRANTHPTGLKQRWAKSLV